MLSNRQTSVLCSDKEHFSESKSFFALKNESMSAEMYALLYIYCDFNILTCLGVMLRHCLFVINRFN